MLLKCGHCSRTFDKPLREYRRQIKNGRNPNTFYCSISCAASSNNKNRSPETLSKLAMAAKTRFTGHNHNKTNPFGYYLKNAKCRQNRKREIFDIDEKYLQQLWLEQDGKCAITGITINHNSYNKNTTTTPQTASLDRIDQSLGYIKGNVQFVAVSINLGKWKFSDDQIREFIEEVKKL